ncbi:MAG: dipeptidase [Pseudomonadales bacterium]
MNIEQLHRDALIIDGLNFYSDGDNSALRDAHIDAVNITVCNFEADYEQTCDELAQWLVALEAANCPWQAITEVEDFERARAAGKTGLIMGWQNMRAIGDNLDRLTLFHRLGIRVMQPTYNRRNFLGDGCLEAHDGGLSKLGHQAVEKMNDLGIAIDLSHVGDETSLQAAQHSAKPVLITHANAKALVDVPRNRTDALIKAVAAGGGVIGTSIYGTMCWDGDTQRRPQLSDYLRQVEYIAELVGPEHVAIGTDLPCVDDLEKIRAITEATLKRYPEAVSTYAAAFGNDIRARYIEQVSSHGELTAITTALCESGWSEREIRGLLGENFKRALAQIWK